MQCNNGLCRASTYISWLETIYYACKCAKVKLVTFSAEVHYRRIRLKALSCEQNDMADPGGPCYLAEWSPSHPLTFLPATLVRCNSDVPIASEHNKLKMYVTKLPSEAANGKINFTINHNIYRSLVNWGKLVFASAALKAFQFSLHRE